MKKIILLSVMTLISVITFGKTTKVIIKKSKMTLVKEFTMYVEQTPLTELVPKYGGFDFIEPEIFLFPNDTLHGSKKFALYELTKDAEWTELRMEMEKSNLFPISPRVMFIAYYETCFVIPINKGLTTCTYYSKDLHKSKLAFTFFYKKEAYLTPMIVNLKRRGDSFITNPLMASYQKGDFVIFEVRD